jgi:hypothetical protein
VQPRCTTVEHRSLATSSNRFRECRTECRLPGDSCQCPAWVYVSPQDELAAVEAAMRENVQLMMQKGNGNSSPSGAGPS